MKLLAVLMVALGATAPAPVTAPETSARALIAEPRAVRASMLIGARLHDRLGTVIGAIRDLAIDLQGGDVPHALFDSAAGRRIGVELDDVEGTPSNLRLAENARLRWLPPAFAPAGATVLATPLLGRAILGTRRQQIGRLTDLAIDLRNSRVHFAMLETATAPAGEPASLRAFPIQLLMPTAGGELVLALDHDRLLSLPRLDASGWSHMLQPDRLAAIERSFIADFPHVWDHAPVTLFDYLDVDRSGTLDRTEADAHEPLRGLWNRIDFDNDGRVSRPEFILTLPRPPRRE